MTDFRAYGINPEKGRKYENIIYVIALIYETYMEKVSKYLAQYKLSPAKFNLLMIVRYQGKAEGITQVAISERLIVSAGNITGLVERLVKDGLITRKQNPDNRRENIIKVTPKAEKLIDSLWDGYDKLVQELTNAVAAKDQPELAKILEAWFAKINEKK